MKINKFLAATTLWMGQIFSCCNGLSAVEQRVDSIRETVIQELEMRVAFDFGSGEAKMIVCSVDPTTNKVVKIWLTRNIIVEVRKDQANSLDGSLSPAIEKQLIDTIQTLKQEAAAFNPKKFAAVGTSVFRTAKNGLEVLERILAATGLEIMLCEHLEEGKLGFTTGVAASGLPAEEVIVWDIGAGSNQWCAIVDGNFKMYGVEYAYVKAMEELFKIRKQTFSTSISPNPVSRTEAFELIEIIKSHLPPREAWMNDPNKKLVTVDQFPTLMRIMGFKDVHAQFTRQDIMDLLETLYDKTDVQLNQMYTLNKAPNLLASLITVCAMMEHCGFEEIHHYNVRTAGSALGMTITPHYWHDYVDFVLVRHGETPWNETKELTNPRDPNGPKIMGPIIQGASSDIPLNAKGEAQAVEAGAKIAQKNLAFKRIVSSPLKRAAKTADTIAQKIGLVPERDPNFRACNWGECEARVKEYRAEKYGYDLFGNYRGSNPDWRTMPTLDRWNFNPIPGAETTNSMINRMKASFKRIAAEAQDRDRVLVVTHQENMKSLILHCNAHKIEQLRLNGQFDELAEYEKTPIANCSLHKFRFNKITEEVSYLGPM